jgi:hypothetical protein
LSNGENQDFKRRGSCLNIYLPSPKISCPSKQLTNEAGSFIEDRASFPFVFELNSIAFHSCGVCACGSQSLQTKTRFTTIRKPSTILLCIL